MLRKLLFAGALAASTALPAAPASARTYVSVSIGSGYPSYGYSGYGYSPYGYSYPGYSYGYAPYGYSYPRNNNGYSYPSYGRGYSTYGYSYPSYRYGAYSCKPRRHHRNGVVWYTRGC